MALESIFAQLESMGLIVLLIFVLVFTVVFAILQKVNIFGEPAKAKKFNVMIALVMGALVVFPHVLWGSSDPTASTLSNGLPDIVNIITMALPNVSIVLVAILMALLIIGMLGKRFEIGGNSLSGWIALGAFVLILYIFGNAAGWWDNPAILDFLFGNPDLLALVIVVLVFAIVIWFIVKEDTPTAEEKKIGYQLDKMLK